MLDDLISFDKDRTPSPPPHITLTLATNEGRSPLGSTSAKGPESNLSQADDTQGETGKLMLNRNDECHEY